MQMIIALIIGIALLLCLVLMTKVHPFLALIISATFIGIGGGLPAADVPNAIINGFGGTLGSIGIIIGFGVMMGQIFDKTGAASGWPSPSSSSLARSGSTGPWPSPASSSPSPSSAIPAL